MGHGLWAYTLAIITSFKFVTWVGQLIVIGLDVIEKCLQTGICPRQIECILKAQVPGVSMRPSPCTDTDDLLCCSATVGNLGEKDPPGYGGLCFNKRCLNPVEEEKCICTLEFHDSFLIAIHDPMCITDPQAFLFVIHVIFHVLLERLYCSYARLSLGNYTPLCSQPL